MLWSSRTLEKQRKKFGFALFSLNTFLVFSYVIAFSIIETQVMLFCSFIK